MSCPGLFLKLLAFCLPDLLFCLVVCWSRFVTEDKLSTKSEEAVLSRSMSSSDFAELSMFAVQGANGEVVKSEWFRCFALNFELAFLSGFTA